jgi:asparaginyl-tRNA synthetase
MHHESPTRIADIFAGTVAPGTIVRIEGWVRTRRDSKAGFSFVHVNDGSTLAPLQVVAPRERVLGGGDG